MDRVTVCVAEFGWCSVSQPHLAVGVLTCRFMFEIFYL